MKNSFFIKCTCILSILVFSCHVHAQEGTRSTGNTSSRTMGRIMLIPFEPKLYMSEIDKKVNEQTHWNFNQIRENFRRQLDAQMQLKLKRYSSVVSFYADSAKMYKDLNYIYTNTHLSFDPIDKPKSGTQVAARETGIKDGQVAVEMSNEKIFTNILPNDLQVMTYLHTKYKAEYFIFINQLDIKNDMSSYNIHTDSYLRKVDVHYTILDKTGKLIAAGISSSGFSSKENNPKKIIAQSFSPVATYIATKFINIVVPPEQPPLPQKK